MSNNPDRKRPINYLSFLKSSILSLVLSFITVSTTFAAEPAINTPSGYFPSPYSLALRNDGVLLQFGGMIPIPMGLDGIAATPIQPDAVIWSGIDSIYENDNTSSIQGDVGGNTVILMTSTSEVYVWQTENFMNNVPTPVTVLPSDEALSGVKEVIVGESTNLLVTQTGDVFSFNIDLGITAIQISELSDVKTIRADYA
ncbi:MAG: hypothetical protein IMF12_01425, partial [Proteobacteria bacterium]|nr:hypothetical protein [Pseudomonadota bacterium]